MTDEHRMSLKLQKHRPVAEGTSVVFINTAKRDLLFNNNLYFWNMMLAKMQIKTEHNDCKSHQFYEKFWFI